MAKRRKPVSAVAGPPPLPPVPVARPVASRHAIDVLAAFAALLCVVLGYLSRHAINPDGVSYLDLSAALLRGDAGHFVQGYWSPLLSVMVAGPAAIAGWRGAQLVPLAHGINTVAALGGLLVVWHWARSARGNAASPRRMPAGFGVGAIAAYLLVSAGMPRIEAVTPDVLLLTLAAWIARELCSNGGRRWLLVGALFGASFLAKTSCWPWLLLAFPLLAWAAKERSDRRRVAASAATCLLVALCWIVPMSLKYGRVTLGSTGRLNYSWYINANTSRLPDADRGANSSYHPINVAGAEPLTLAVFDDASAWTYQPWGDPTGWHDHVVAETGKAPGLDQLVLYWLRSAVLVFGVWMLPTMVAVVLPAWLLQRRAAIGRELLTWQRNPLVVMVLGLAGLLQFTLVHAEPRLLAPFGIMLALGALSWCYAAPADASPVRGRWRVILAWCGILAAIGFAVPKFLEAFRSASRLQQATAQLDALRVSAQSSGRPIDRIAIVGPAAPVMGVAYWIGAHIAEQIPPESAERLARLPPRVQDEILQSVFGGRIAMVWQTDANGGMRMLIVPPKQ